ncbi:MAG: patatin-like phospholipase family protein [Phycisphaeraceae bacterium]|nr:patatin-like phospholipase family protein [Phycisphaeraceae bacterium]
MKYKLIAAIGIAIAIAGCSSSPSRPVLTDAQLTERAGEDTKEMISNFQRSVGNLVNREQKRTAAAGGQPVVMNILAMSGGGDYGAFGAGFLVGWGKAPDPAWRRPEFDGVTGVSTGAMLAPFAYVGTDESCLTVEEFYRNPKKDWTEERGLLFFLPSNPSFATIPGLTRDLQGVIDQKFVAQMAEESKKGKLLIVSATDLDLGRQRFWELGEEAQDAIASGNLDRVHKIMLASAAIPAVFPPIGVGEEIYCDGGVTANVFLRLDYRSPFGFIHRWKELNPDKPLPKVRFWVIINNQLAHIPKTVQEKWPDVAGPALEVAIRSATITEAKLLAAEADYVNLKYNADIEVRVTAIPDSWRPPVPGDFEKATMDSLADLGRKMGEDPKSWQLWSLPSSASGPGAAPATRN